MNEQRKRAIRRLLLRIFSPREYREVELHDALCYGDAVAVKKWLVSVADVNAGTRAFLKLAVESGRIEIVKMLLAKGANVNLADSNGWVPLHSATHGREIAELLVAHGADVNARNKNGVTPLYSAVNCRNPDLDVVSFYLDQGADINARDSHGNTPLRAARLWLHDAEYVTNIYACVELLEERGGKK